MEPLYPMKPMRPLTPAKQWWPEELGDSSSSGAQDDARYAFFGDKRLLLVERGGQMQRFRTGEHRIIGISQASGREELTFTSQHGPVTLEEFEKEA
jgi:hypothetical protein